MVCAFSVAVTPVAYTLTAVLAVNVTAISAVSIAAMTRLPDIIGISSRYFSYLVFLFYHIFLLDSIIISIKRQDNDTYLHFPQGLLIMKIFHNLALIIGNVT